MKKISIAIVLMAAMFPFAAFSQSTTTSSTKKTDEVKKYNPKIVEEIDILNKAVMAGLRKSQVNLERFNLSFNVSSSRYSYISCKVRLNDIKTDKISTLIKDLSTAGPISSVYLYNYRGKYSLTLYIYKYLKPTKKKTTLDHVNIMNNLKVFLTTDTSVLKISKISLYSSSISINGIAKDFTEVAKIVESIKIFSKGMKITVNTYPQIDGKRKFYIYFRKYTPRRYSRRYKRRYYRKSTKMTLNIIDDKGKNKTVSTTYTYSYQIYRGVRLTPYRDLRGKVSGYYFKYVRSNSLFYKMGFRTDDILLDYNGKKITTSYTFYNMIRAFNSSKDVIMTFKRGNKKMTIKVLKKGSPKKII